MVIPNNVDIADLPGNIAYLYVLSTYNIPVSLSFYEECIDKYPEYFPDELEWRTKLGEVPQTVHEDYNKDIAEKDGYIFTHINKGLVYMTNNPKETEDIFKLSNELYGTDDEIWNRHYGKYGLVKN